MLESLLDVPDKFNIASFIVDSHIQQGCGHRPAIFYNDKSLSYQDLYHGVNKTGNMLKELGLIREQRVLIMLPDCPEFFFAFLGVMKIGAVAVPVNTMLTSKDYAYYLQDSRAWGLIVAEELLPMVEEIIPLAPELKEVFVVGGEGHKYQHFHQLISAASQDLEPVKPVKMIQLFGCIVLGLQECLKVQFISTMICFLQQVIMTGLLPTPVPKTGFFPYPNYIFPAATVMACFSLSFPGRQ